MDDRDYSDISNDKHWAAKYILGPLHDPEPSQLCATRVGPRPPPSPPTSASPTHGNFFASRSSKPNRASTPPEDDDDQDRPFLKRILSRSNSVTNKPLPPSPPRAARTKYPPLTGLERKKSVHTANPPQTRWNQGTILSRANSVASSRPSVDGSAPGAPRDNARPTHRRTSSLAERHLVERNRRPPSVSRPPSSYRPPSSSRPPSMLAQDHAASTGAPQGPAKSSLPRRGNSLRERFPGDMSHRPLAMIQREHRAADRAPHLHNHRRQQPSDTIDTLDLGGPNPEVPYHHEGPFDPAMAERNVGKKLAPIDAVEGGNLEALKATPVEFVRDSLEKGVPLQGVGVVPPGERDWNGRRMSYREGADLMREGNAPGGAYKRWDGLQYRDDDLKGKGEPVFSQDVKRRELRAKTRRPVATEAGKIQVQAPQEEGEKGKGPEVTERSVDDDDVGLGSSRGEGGLRRSGTTGRSLTQSLRRRFGSLRRKKEDEY